MSPMYHPTLMVELKLHCHCQIELAAEKWSRAADSESEGRYVTGHWHRRCGDLTQFGYTQSRWRGDRRDCVTVPTNTQSFGSFMHKPRSSIDDTNKKLASNTHKTLFIAIINMKTRRASIEGPLVYSSMNRVCVCLTRLAITANAAEMTRQT